MEGQPAYGAPPQGQVIVQQQMPVQRKEMPCCPDSEVDVSETAGLIICILNCIPGTSPLGTLVSSCLDRNGCNCTAFWVSWAQSFCFIFCFAGYIWAIMHGLAIYHNSKGKI